MEVLSCPTKDAVSTTAAPEVLFGVSRGGAVLDICARAFGGVDTELSLVGSDSSDRGPGGRRLFASFDTDDDEPGFVATVLGWRPNLRSQAELLAIARAVGNDGGRSGFRSADALHYFELISRS